MARLSKLELRIMEALWSQGPSSIREVQQSFPEKGRPAYTTVQTMVYRLEAKKVVRRAKKISNAHIFEATLSRDAAQRRSEAIAAAGDVDDIASAFAGLTQGLAQGRDVKT